VHDSSDATLVEDRRTRDELNGTETILVVDDEEALGEVTRRLLIRSGYQVLSASNGMQAVEIASTFDGTIDLLLTDVVMPKMQGRPLRERFVNFDPTCGCCSCRDTHIQSLRPS